MNIKKRFTRFGVWVMLIGLVAFGGSPLIGAPLNVKDPMYGAVGDGVTDDRAAIQKAIDDASLSGGVDSVYIPTGTYLLGSRAPGRGSDPDNAATAIFWLSSNVTIVGDGTSSVLLVKGGPEGLNVCDPAATPKTGGFSVFEALRDESVENIELRSFVIDGNAAENPLPSTPPAKCAFSPPYPGAPFFNHHGRFVTIWKGRSVVVEDCLFRNSNSRQILHFGDPDFPLAMSDIQVLNNTFQNHALDPKQDDHSSIYSIATVTHQVENLVEGNTLINEPEANPTHIGTALEIHGSHTRVRNNLVRNYLVGANVPATVVTSVANHFVDNDFRAIAAGFNLWAFPPFELQETVIDGNRVEQAFVRPGTSLIDWKNVFSPVRDLIIHDNTLTSSVEGIDHDGGRKGNGISIEGYTKNAQITGNRISFIECIGIRVAGPNRDVPEDVVVNAADDALYGVSWVDGLTIEDNRIRDPGSWGKTNSGCSVGVSLVSPDDLVGYEISGVQMVPSANDTNRIRYVPDDPNDPNIPNPNNPRAEVGLRLRGPIQNSSFVGIEMLDAVHVDVQTPGSVDLENVLIDHHDLGSADSPNDQFIRACPGSSWITSEGKTWEKPVTATCNSPSDWVPVLVGGF